MAAPGRQKGFRVAAISWLCLSAVLGLAVLADPARLGPASQAWLIGGIVLGAILIGWRLTQLPKNQSLEFLLVSPVSPSRLYLLEAGIGMARLGLVVLSALPVFVALVLCGRADWPDLLPLVLQPWCWGCFTGIALSTWAYESRGVRRVGERMAIAGIVCYLIVGVLAGEKLRDWLGALPQFVGQPLMEAYVTLHTWNPFAIQEMWFLPDMHPMVALERMAGMTFLAISVSTLVMFRAAYRLKGHFDDRHYRPLTEAVPADTAGIEDRPLAWWAVRRVMEYSGRINLYLAGGFGAAYALYLVAGDAWPTWLGRTFFQIVEASGGVPAVTTGLVLLAAVPAAFQYGLWDSSTQDRLRRLELLLLTRLHGADYWDAATAAAWSRGRGYLIVAVMLWLAGWWSGRLSLAELGFVAACSTLLWACHFAVGFHVFSGGLQSSGIASMMVLGLPLLAYVGFRLDAGSLAMLTPPGLVYGAQIHAAPGYFVLIAFALGLAVLLAARRLKSSCEPALRSWYDRNHGLKLLD
ncbi:MAG: hypothetical protein K1X57_02310 [Gemmataceae bacterium]|nr:hypothetical protein [Gemmataceae bacterium]